MSGRETARVTDSVDEHSKALSEVEDLVAIVCAACGVSYMAGVKTGQNALVCPQCGPSIPIDESPRQRRRFFPRPKLRLSLGLLQFLVLGLTFAVFLGIVLSTLNTQHGSKKPLSTDVIVQRLLGRPPANRGGQRRGNSRGSGAAATASNVPAGSAPLPVANRSVGGDTTATESPDATAQRSARPTAASQNVSARERAMLDDLGRMQLVTSHSTVNELSTVDEFATVDESATRDELAMRAIPPIPKENVTVKYVMENADRLMGRQVSLLCQLVSIHDDAQDRVPNRFEVDGRSVRLDSSEEISYRRLEIRDVDGRPFQNVYLKNEDELASQFAWLKSGDWVVLTATPGQRMRPLGRMEWGMIVTQISPAEPVVQVPTAINRPAGDPSSGVATRPKR